MENNNTSKIHLILSLCIPVAGMIGFRLGYRFMDPSDGLAYSFSIVFIWLVLSAVSSVFWTLSGKKPFWFIPLIIIASALVNLLLLDLLDISCLLFFVPAGLIPAMFVIIISHQKSKKADWRRSQDHLII